MALADSWHLRSCSPVCSVTGRKFAADELFYTAIFPDPESEAFERRDFSADAWNDRGDVNARKGREGSRRALKRALGASSKNRLQTYEDEAELLERLAARLRKDGRGAHAAVIEAQHETALALLDADRALIEGSGPVNSAGMAESVLKAVGGE